jgi:hypothetical protein
MLEMIAIGSSKLPMVTGTITMVMGAVIRITVTTIKITARLEIIQSNGIPAPADLVEA